MSEKRHMGYDVFGRNANTDIRMILDKIQQKRTYFHQIHALHVV